MADGPRVIEWGVRTDRTRDDDEGERLALLRGGEAPPRSFGTAYPAGDSTVELSSHGSWLGVPGSGGGPRARVVADKPPDVAEPDLLQRRPYMGYLIVLGCIGAFVMEIALNDWTIEPLSLNPMVGPSVNALIRSGAKVTSLIQDGEWWRLFSQLFLHAGVLHFGFNMVTLIKHGFQMEREAGVIRFGLVYVCAGVMASTASTAFLPGTVSVGASGAIFGILGAVWGDFIQNHYQICRESCKSCSLYFISLAFSTAFNLAIGLLPFIDNFAHSGGFLGGVLIGSAVMIRPDAGRRSASSCQITCATISVVVYIILVAVGLAAIFLRWDVVALCPDCHYISCVDTPWWSCSQELQPAGAGSNGTSPADGVARTS